MPRTLKRCNHDDEPRHTRGRKGEARFLSSKEEPGIAPSSRDRHSITNQAVLCSARRGGGGPGTRDCGEVHSYVVLGGAQPCYKTDTKFFLSLSL